MILTCACIVVPARAGTLYSTEFEEFPAGDGQWAGNEGWQTNDTGGAAEGIIQDPVNDLDLGRAGFLGFGTPTSLVTSVFRTINHDPVATGTSTIHFDSLLGVQDSTNGNRDRFHISIYSIAGDFLAALTFDNTTGNILSDDGSTVRDTGVSFQRGDQLLGVAALQILEIEIDLEANRWSAALDGVPLFEQTFTATASERSLGTVAAEWDIAANSTEMAGDNWLLVADWLVASIPDEPFAVHSIERDAAGAATLTWAAHPGFDYQVAYSADLESWREDLPNSTFSSSSQEGMLSFTDDAASTETKRYYRVLRTPTP